MRGIVRTGGVSPSSANLGRPDVRLGQALAVPTRYLGSWDSQVNDFQNEARKGARSRKAPEMEKQSRIDSFRALEIKSLADVNSDQIIR